MQGWRTLSEIGVLPSADNPRGRAQGRDGPDVQAGGDRCNALTPHAFTMPTRRLIKLDPELRSRIGLWMAALGYACMLASIVLLGMNFLDQLR